MRGTVLGLLALGLVGCDASSSIRTEEVTLEVRRVTFPAATTADAPLNVDVEVITGGCRQFGRLEGARAPGGLLLRAVGTDVVLGPDFACTADIRYSTHTYTDHGTSTRSNPFEIIVNGKSWGTVAVQ